LKGKNLEKKPKSRSGAKEVFAVWEGGGSSERDREEKRSVKKLGPGKKHSKLLGMKGRNLKRPRKNKGGGSLCAGKHEKAP